MSGILAQAGFADEVLAPLTPTAIVQTAATASTPLIATVTFAAPHGILRGASVVLTGFTPSGYNGTWVVDSVPSGTTLTIIMTATVAVGTVFGTVTASAYGTATTVTRFFDFNSENIKLDLARIESASLRAATRVIRSDRWVNNKKGVGGPLDLEVRSKGFGYWLKHLVGSVPTTTGPTDSAYTHTAAIGGTYGHSFTAQVGRPFTPSQVVEPFTYVGCKVTAWEIDCALDAPVMLKLTIDGQDEQLTVPLAAAAYASNDEILTFIGATISIGGTVWDGCNHFNLKCDMGMNSDRRFLRGNSLQKEPVESKFRQITFEADGDFDGLSNAYARYLTAAPGAGLPQIVATFAGVSLIGASTFPSLVATMPACRFDGDTPAVAGPKELDVKAVGTALTKSDGTAALTLSYTTLDSTP